MLSNVDELTEQARPLSAADKLKLVDNLLHQLDLPDPRLESIWAEEVAKRRAAYLSGKISARPYEEVMQRYRVQ